MGFKMKRVLFAPTGRVPCTPVRSWKMQEADGGGSPPRGGRGASAAGRAAVVKSFLQVEEEEEEKTLMFLRERLREERRRRRNLTVQFSELKSSYSLLSDLCDELAEGIREYEQESRERNRDRRIRLVVHVAESWLDARSQMKAADSSGDLTARRSIDGRIAREIEEFLRSRRSDRRQSVVSVSGPCLEESRRSDFGDGRRRSDARMEDGGTLEARLMEARIDERQGRLVPGRVSSAGTCILSPLTEDCRVRRPHCQR